MAQHFSVRAVLKFFDDRSEKSVIKELTQMHNIHTYDSVDPKKFAKKHKMDYLISLMLLIEKLNVNVKARAYADGSKQGVMITSAIEAREERNVAIIDTPGAFLHALTDEEIYMILNGTLAELMVMVNHS